LQAQCCVTQSNPLRRSETPVAGKWGPVVSQGKREAAVGAPGRQLDRAGSRARGHAVPDRVFHQWLQYQVGHERVLQIFRDINRDAQPIAEAAAFDVEVALQLTDAGRLP